MQQKIDFIVIGSGIAGLNAALTLSVHGNVLIITKKAITDSATSCAQGGIAAVTNAKDSFDAHLRDTLIAGNFHNKKTAVKFLVVHGPKAIEKLVEVGVSFDKNTSFEAAHSFPRILHATDFTGQEIEKSLIAAVLKTPSITVWENTYAVDLIVSKNHCFGVQVIKNKSVIPLFSRATILATGGAGQLYAWTTNPSVATADGIAMAARVGAKLADLEFMQFHPTAFKEKVSPLLLLSEALRGEGAVLQDEKGDRFMLQEHADAELAPRDVVARAIFKKQKEATVYIDIRQKGKEFLIKRFPNIYRALQKKGFDLSKDRIPVTPAAHFLCGGIVTDTKGRTSVKNLFAYGEVSATGVHGANRLASNSLLEGMVFSSQIASCIKALPKRVRVIDVVKTSYKKKIKSNNFQKSVKEIMWKYVGIERSAKGLRHAIEMLKNIEEKVKKEKGVNETCIETKNMIQVALLIATAASRRKKSLGTHYII